MKRRRMRLIMIDAMIEFMRQMMTLVVLIWNYRLFKQTDSLIKMNFELLERIPDYNIDHEVTPLPSDEPTPRLEIISEDVEIPEPINLANEFEDEVNSDLPELSVDINFDEASEAWRANKIYEGNGTYRYHRFTSPPRTPPRPRNVSPPPAPSRRRRYNTRQAARERDEIRRNQYVAAG